MISIIPTILEGNEKDFARRLGSVRPYFSRAQIDVCNGTFVEANTFADPSWVQTHAKEMTFEVDLMVDLDDYGLTQWDIPCVDTIIFHREATKQPYRIIETIRKMGKRVFVSLNPETSLDVLDDVLDDVDGVLLLGVTPGKSGNPFQKSTLNKVHMLRHILSDKVIEVDGGVSNETLLPLLTSGADAFAVGSYFGDGYIEERLFDLLGIVERYEKEHPSGEHHH